MPAAFARIAGRARLGSHPMRFLCCVVLCALSAAQIGCALVQQGTDVASSTLKSVRPNAKGYADDNNEDFVDTWSEAGEEGRGDRPLEKESDGLTPYLESPKARAINRSLGID
jgi:hypothetical protein